LLGVLGVARAWKLCQNPLGSDKVFQALVRSSAGSSPSSVLEPRLVGIILRHYLRMGDLSIIVSHSFASLMLFVHLHTI
jgi:hypothetical protein